MNRKFTLLIVAVAIVLVGVAISQQDTAPVDLAKGTATPTPGPIFSFGESELQEVMVEGPGGQTYTLARVAGGWEVDGAQASDVVSSTVGNLATLVATQTLRDRNPSDYGFAAPALTVTLKTAAGAETTFQVGDETLVETGSRYLRKVPDDGAILVVSSFHLQQLLDWLAAPPLAPTATPEATATSEEEAATSEEADGTASPEGDADPSPATTPAAGAVESPAPTATAEEGPVTPASGPTPSTTIIPTAAATP